MSHIQAAYLNESLARWLAAVIGTLLILGLMHEAIESAGKDGEIDSAKERWLAPHDCRRDRETPALVLGEMGRFDDQHIFAPHVIQQDGEFWMYYSGSQRCVEAGTYKGVAKDPAQPEKSDQREDEDRYFKRTFSSTGTVLLGS